MICDWAQCIPNQHDRHSIWQTVDHLAKSKAALAVDACRVRLKR
jgi:hypothetical protein